MRSSALPEFWEHYRRLPGDVRELARNCYRLWRLDPSHPSLHFKLISRANRVFSVRISKSYRALAMQDGDILVWFWIGAQDEYDRIIG